MSKFNSNTIIKDSLIFNYCIYYIFTKKNILIKEV